MGTVEILDTEQGRNLAELINAGVTVGISARGMGDLVGDEVDPDTYNFKTFDITMRPSDPNARLVPIMESEGRRVVILESEESDRLIKGSEDPEVEEVVQEPSKLDKRQLIASLYQIIGNPEGMEVEVTNHGINFTNGEEFLGGIWVDTPVESDEDCFIISSVGCDVDSVRVPLTSELKNLSKDSGVTQFIDTIVEQFKNKVKEPVI